MTRRPAAFHYAVTITVMFLLIAVFRYRDYDDKSLDFQTLLRLGSWTLAVGYVAWFHNDLIRLLRRRNLLPWLLFHLYAIIHISVAANWIFGLTGALSFLIFYCFVGTILLHFGREFFVDCFFATMTIVGFASLVVYFAVPSFGRLGEWVGNVRLPSNRMSGITGNSNGMGYSAGVAIVIAAFYWREITLLPGWLKKSSMLVLTLCLIMSINRMSIVAAGVCLLVYAIGLRRNGLVLFGLWMIAAAVLALALVYGSDLLPLLSRSGDVRELTTGTSRSGIWAAVWDLVGDRPLLGWGHAAAIAIFPYYPGLFTQAAHAHNLYLDLLFSRGALGLALFFCALAVSYGTAIADRRGRPAILMVYFLIVGFTESLPLYNVVWIGFLAFAFCVFEMSGLSQLSRVRPGSP